MFCIKPFYLLVFWFFNLSTVFIGFAQQDFNHFQNIISEGGIPADFTAQTYNKVLDDIKSDKAHIKSSIKERIFLEGIHYAINDLLHSGMVTYGDDVTTYVDEVASNLLKGNDKLRQELRFYTIKSNETNAFSTFQGIIFVTTGLISQLTSEAQLAYVLSHEIAHYTERHVVETFDWRDKNKNRVSELSNYSKDHEFEADRLGLDLYEAAGYTKDEIFSTFDVLLFSYLPFEEIEFPMSYLNSEKLTIPDNFYPKEAYPIKAIEDADDKKSSHPNIKRRKDAIKTSIDSHNNWGNQIFIFGEEKFNYIRQICRFESIRTNIRAGEFDDALYSIFILEKQFPNSIYLKRMKARAWLGVAQHKKNNTLNSHLPKKGNHEGAISNLQILLKNMDKLQISTISMRMIEDLRLENPNDTMINAIWSRMVKTLANTEKFNISKFSVKSYKQALEEFNVANAQTIAKDSVSVVKVDEENLSKYEKIKRQKTSSTNPAVTLFDTSSFYIYGLNDLIESTHFLTPFEAFKKELDDKEAADLAYNSLTKSNRKKLKKLNQENQLRLEEKSIIYVEPQVVRYKKGKVDRIRSEKLAEQFSDAIVSVSRQIDLNVVTISSSRLSAFGTDGFNERSVLMSYLSEISENESIDLLPTDYLSLIKIQEQYGTDKVMFSLLEHSYNASLSDINPSLYCSIIFYPILFVIVPLKILRGNQVELSVIVLDIKKGDIEGRSSYSYHEPLTKYSIKARVYDLLTQVKSKPLNK